MQLTTDQKRKSIKLIASGKADAKDFKAVSERHFIRVSVMPAQDEININEAGEPQLNINQDTIFKCIEDGKEYAYSDIEAMAGNAPFVNTWYSIAGNPPTEPACIDEIEIMPVTSNERIHSYIINCTDASSLPTC